MVLQDSFAEFGVGVDCTQCKRLFDPEDWLQITCKVCKEDLKSHGDIYAHYTIHSEYQQGKDESELIIPKKEPIFSSDLDSEPQQPSAKCGICNLPFYDLDALNMHIKMHHGKKNSVELDLDQVLFNREVDLNIKTEDDYVDDNFESKLPEFEDSWYKQPQLDQSVMQTLVPETILKPMPAKKEKEPTIEEKYPVFIKCFHCDTLCPTVDKLAEHNIAKHSDATAVLNNVTKSTKTKVEEIDEIEEDNMEEQPGDTNEINKILDAMSIRWRDEVKKIRYRISENPDDTICKICGKQFWSKSYLLGVHMPSTHEKDVANMIQCDECGKTFNRQRYHQHKHMVHRKEPFTCLLCNDFKAWDKNHIIAHKKKVHGIIFNTSTKKYEKLSAEKLKPINMTQIDKSNFSCVYCGLKMTEKFKMQTHVVSVHETEYKDDPLSRYRELPGETLECLICGQTSENNKYIMQHHIFSEHSEYIILKNPTKRTHRGMESQWQPEPDKIRKEGDYYFCTYCDSKSKNKHAMWRHIFKSHEWRMKPDDQRISVCHICGYRTGDRQYMTKHIKYVHEGVKRPKKPPRPKNHNCHICAFKAKWNCELQVHIQNVHEGIKGRRIKQKT